MTKVIVRSSDELMTAFAAANDGDEILLEAGEYGLVKLADRSFETGIRIASLDENNPAVFTDRVEISNSANVIFEDFSLEADGKARYNSYSRIAVKSSENITIRDGEVIGHVLEEGEGKSADDASATRNDALVGFGWEPGLGISGSTNVTVENIDFSDLRVAVHVQDAKGVELTGLEIHDVREGINFLDVQDLTIRNNVFRDFNAFNVANTWSGDHSDMIQFWGYGAKSGIDGVVIADNMFLQGEGNATQSIFGHMVGADEGIEAKNFTITGNVISNSSVHGISLSNVHGALISNNILMPSSPDLAAISAPQIRLWSDNADTIVENNLLPAYSSNLSSVIFGWGRDAEARASLNLSFSGNETLNATDSAALSAFVADDLKLGLISAQEFTNLTFSAFGIAAEAESAPTLQNAGASLGTGGMLLFGDMQADTLKGADAADVIMGGAGADRIEGAGGADVLGGGDGRDTIFGGDGDDLIFGERGVDMLYGGRGNDWIDGGGGRDKITGGDGDDQIFGGKGSDTLGGGNGNDSLEGAGGRDRLYGGAGDDELFGGAGRDFLSGDLGNDQLEGGDGADVFIFRTHGGGADVVTDFSFDEGDVMRIRGLGKFDEASDFTKAADKGAFSIVDGQDGDMLLFADGQSIELVGIDLV